MINSPFLASVTCLFTLGPRKNFRAALKTNNTSAQTYRLDQFRQSYADIFSTRMRVRPLASLAPPSPRSCGRVAD